MGRAACKLGPWTASRSGRDDRHRPRLPHPARRGRAGGPPHREPGAGPGDRHLYVRAGLHLPRVPSAAGLDRPDRVRRRRAEVPPARLLVRQVVPGEGPLFRRRGDHLHVDLCAPRQVRGRIGLLVHAPRFLYDPSAYFSRRSVAKSFELATTPLRHRDRKAAVAHRRHLAVSARTAKRLREAYGIEAEVLYPPFDSSRFAGLRRCPTGITQRPRRLAAPPLQTGRHCDPGLRPGRHPTHDHRSWARRGTSPLDRPRAGDLRRQRHRRRADRRLRQAQHGPGARDRGLRLHPPRGGIAWTASRGGPRRRARGDRC